jgi:hypothetical protein
VDTRARPFGMRMAVLFAVIFGLGIWLGKVL